jgi:alginate O-acetyltransferase complex protein AlgI
MIFSSIQYLLFLPVVALLYWNTRGQARLVVTVVASYIFYMSWLPIYGILLFLMTCFNWALGVALEWSHTKNRSLLKPLLTLGLTANLGCLCYYKYANFFLSNLCAGLNCVSESLAGTHISWTLFNVVLPLGISFFVFEFVHYLVDVYKGDKPIRSWLEFAAFAAFFPSQIAGPIKRYQDFIHNLRAPLPWCTALLSEGGALIVQGLFKKVAIADPINGIIANSFVAGATLSSADAWIACIAFPIQCYCDFSGYTDIGRGSALLLGIRLPENFRLPLLAVDSADFWRRWHMSLSFWLRDYVYIPLGGSRSGGLKNARNLFITMVACGLWHGAAWHYVLYGCTQGIGLIVQRRWRQYLESIEGLARWSATTPAKLSGIFLTTCFTITTFALFRAPDVSTWWHILSCWFGSDMSSTLWVPIVKSGLPVFITVYAGFWLATEAVKRLRKLDLENPAPVYPLAFRYASWTVALFLMLAARPTAPTPFVYFQF